jgi:hypothetical protein
MFPGSKHPGTPVLTGWIGGHHTLPGRRWGVRRASRPDGASQFSEPTLNDATRASGPAARPVNSLVQIFH